MTEANVPNLGSVHVVVGSLECGGSERAASALVNHLARANPRSQIVLTTLYPVEDFFGLDDRVTRVRLNVGVYVREGWFNGIAGRILKIRRHLRKYRHLPLVVFGDQTAALFGVASLGLSIKMLAAERRNPFSSPMPHHWRVLRWLLFHRVALIIVQTESLANAWSRRLWPFTKTVVIPNSISHISTWDSVTSEPRIFFVGRLQATKGLVDLLYCLDGLRVRFPELRCTIIGDGPERSSLVSLANSLGLSCIVNFTGALRDPWENCCPGDIFVFPSYSEGSPNALLEAQSRGLVSVSYDCHFGPSDIISHGINGFLVQVGDIDALGRHIALLLEDRSLRDSMARKATDRAFQHLEEGIMALWAEEIAAVRQSKK